MRGLESVCDVVLAGVGGGVGGGRQGLGFRERDLPHTLLFWSSQEAGLPPIPGLPLLPRTGDHFVLRREGLLELLSTPGWVHGAKH